jgi:hypothetical protein
VFLVVSLARLGQNDARDAQRRRPRPRREIATIGIERSVVSLCSVVVVVVADGRAGRQT